MIEIKFYRVSEKMPENGQEIWYINDSSFYGAHEFRYQEVEYEWVEYDDKGHRTGTTICYEDGDDAPPNCKLFCGLDDDTLWCDTNDIWKALKK
jgi:hypothetical protein